MKGMHFIPIIPSFNTYHHHIKSISSHKSTHFSPMKYLRNHKIKSTNQKTPARNNRPMKGRYFIPKIPRFNTYNCLKTICFSPTKPLQNHKNESTNQKTPARNRQPMKRRIMVPPLRFSQTDINPRFYKLFLKFSFFFFFFPFFLIPN